MSDAVVKFLMTKKQRESESLKPINGVNGTDGIAGISGKDGLNGRDGVNGADGKNGENGRDGSAGKVGARGERGFTGDKGDMGDRGIQGEKGEAGRDGRNGTGGGGGTSRKRVDEQIDAKLAASRIEITFIDSPYPVKESDDFINVDSSGGDVVINFLALGVAKAKPIYISQSDGEPNTTTATADGSETIDDAGSTLAINSDGNAEMFVPFATTWRTF